MATCKKCNGTGKYGGGNCYSCNGTGIYGSSTQTWPSSTGGVGYYGKDGKARKHNVKEYNGTTYGEHTWYNPRTTESGWAGGEANYNSKGGKGNRRGYQKKKDVWGNEYIVDNATGEAYDSIERWKRMTGKK